MKKIPSNVLALITITALVMSGVTTVIAQTADEKKNPTVAAVHAKPGESFTNSVGLELVWVPDGGFWFGKTEVTAAAYKAVMESGVGGDQPVEGISFIKAVTFCAKLTQHESHEGNPNVRIMPLNASYTLPSLKQWRLARDQA